MKIGGGTARLGGMIENERKFVLRLDTDETHFAALAGGAVIEQAYLVANKNQSLRVRKTCASQKIAYSLTFKQTVDKKTVEVETDISAADYILLRKKAVAVLHKVRYAVGGWDIDFFKSGGETYFVQAEFEMPDGQKKPATVPKLITDRLVHAVKRGDGRFSSRKLSDVKYARRLYYSLGVEV